MIEVLCNPHCVQLGSMKNYVFEFISLGHILILSENMLLNLKPLIQLYERTSVTE